MAETTANFQSAMKKLSESIRKFSKARDGHWLKVFENSQIPRNEFKEQLRVGLDCKLKEDELNALLPLVSANTEDDKSKIVDGRKFLLMFIRIRTDHREKLQQDKIANDKRAKDIERAQDMISSTAVPKGPVYKADMEYSKADMISAKKKITEAAAKYDKNMPGAPSLDAFERAFMDPSEFKTTLNQCFAIKLTPKELGAVMKIFDGDENGSISCPEFLITFFRMGFAEKSARIKAEREVKAAHQAAVLEKQKEDKKALKSRNAQKLNMEYREVDKKSAMAKLRETAKKYDRTMPGAPSMSAFDCAVMEPVGFKEQLRRLFNLQVTAAELGALVDYFDANGDGNISCAEFAKSFLSMGFHERDEETRANRKKQQRNEENRIEAIRKKKEAQESKWAMQAAVDFSDEDSQNALHKLTEAAFKYDKNLPGAPNLSAFDAKFMPPHIFKDQLHRAFSIKASTGELAALLSIFDPEGTGEVICADFMIKFIKVGAAERLRRKEIWRKHEKEVEKKRRIDYAMK